MLARVAAGLERAIQAREAAERHLADATAERERLEDYRPSALRRRAQARHGQALAAAHQLEGTATNVLADRLQDECDQRNRLEAIRERSTRTEITREPEPRRRERSRDLGIER